MTNRQPKGTPTGGQFAEGRKPEGLDLSAEDLIRSVRGDALRGLKRIGDGAYGYKGHTITKSDWTGWECHTETGTVSRDSLTEMKYALDSIVIKETEPRTKMRVTNSSGNEFEVRVIRKGERYGRDDCLVNDEGNKFFNPNDPILVEFWDAEQDSAHFPGGCQFVSRYGLKTLTERSGAHAYAGLNLYGGEPKWSIDATTMSDVYEWLTPILAETEQTEKS